MTIKYSSKKPVRHGKYGESEGFEVEIGLSLEESLLYHSHPIVRESRMYISVPVGQDPISLEVELTQEVINSIDSILEELKKHKKRLEIELESLKLKEAGQLALFEESS